ncbi:MAG TPA: murein biosynthesis integral membrane protein MurJ [Rhabdochlamydiaceae bacterium]|jgi:putative peptidoglycan lipid II flippase
MIHNDSPRAVSRSALSFLSGTLLSRLSGLGRDMAMAVAFGSAPAIAAFMVAFRFANVIRRLFGEGNLPAGFIPHFEHIRASSTEQGAQFFRDVLFSLAIFLTLLIGVADLGLLAVWKWGGLSSDSAQIIYLTVLMMPGIVFICLYGLSSALLQCEKRFFLTGFAPVGFNCVWIVAAWWLKDKAPSDAVVYLSVAIVVAFLAQWLVIAPQTFGFLSRALSWKQSLRPRLFSPELKKMIAPFLLGAAGIGAVQINSALDALFARFASLEGPAYLWYAIRIEQLPLALFGIALSSALLPSLARALKNEDYAQYLHLTRFALKRSFSLIFPCCAALFVLGVAGINLLYGRGGFSQQTTYHTVLCLWGYGLGLMPSVFVLFFASAFYAVKEYRIPTIGCILSVLLNVALNGWFVFGLHWGAFSIALATSASAFFNFFYLAHHLKKRCAAPLFDSSVISSFLRVGCSAFAAAVIVLLVGHFLLDDPSLNLLFGEQYAIFARHFGDQLLSFIALSGTFILIFLSYAWMLNAEDFLSFFKKRI